MKMTCTDINTSERNYEGLLDNLTIEEIDANNLETTEIKIDTNKIDFVGKNIEGK